MRKQQEQYATEQRPTTARRVQWWWCMVSAVVGCGIGYTVALVVAESEIAETVVEVQTVERPVLVAETKLEEPVEAVVAPQEVSVTDPLASVKECIDIAYNDLEEQVKNGKIRYREQGDAYNSITYFKLLRQFHDLHVDMDMAKEILFMRYKSEVAVLHELPSFEELHRRGKMSSEEYADLRAAQEELNHKMTALTTK